MLINTKSLSDLFRMGFFFCRCAHVAKKYYKVLYGNTIKKMIILTPDFFAQKLFFDFT